MVSKPETWNVLPDPVNEWLRIQEYRSYIPQPGQLSSKPSRRGSRHYLVCYPFEAGSRTRRSACLPHAPSRAAAHAAAGFFGQRIRTAILGAARHGGLDMDRLFDEDMLGTISMPGLRSPISTSARSAIVAIIAGLNRAQVPRQGEDRAAGDVLLDLIYERRGSTSRITSCCARPMGMRQPVCSTRRVVGDVARVKNRIVTRRLARVSPLAVPGAVEISKKWSRARPMRISCAGEESLIADAIGSTKKSSERGRNDIDLNGERLVLDVSGPLWWPAQAMLVFFRHPSGEGFVVRDARQCCHRTTPAPR